MTSDRPLQQNDQLTDGTNLAGSADLVAFNPTENNLSTTERLSAETSQQFGTFSLMNGEETLCST